MGGQARHSRSSRFRTACGERQGCRCIRRWVQVNTQAAVGVPSMRSTLGLHARSMPRVDGVQRVIPLVRRPDARVREPGGWWWWPQAVVALPGSRRSRSVGLSSAQSAAACREGCRRCGPARRGRTPPLLSAEAAAAAGGRAGGSATKRHVGAAPPGASLALITHTGPWHAHRGPHPQAPALRCHRAPPGGSPWSALCCCKCQ